MSEDRGKVSITLDWKKNRIRITRTVMVLLDNPPYMQLLINPDERVLAIRALYSKPVSFPCEKVRYEGIDERYVELYSALLFEKFSDCFAQFDKKVAYRVFGEVFPEQHVAVFNLLDYKELEVLGSEVDHGTG
mgnify:CR=1 FL=1